VSDGEYVYAIDNHAIAKYRIATGERVATWQGPDGGPVIHQNAGIIRDGRLLVAHSNFPGVPMQGSIEIYDPATLQHVGSHSFGRTDGSFTWLDRHGDRWLACFVHYGRNGGEPGRGPEWTHLVEFDDNWREVGGWTLPPNLIARLGVKGYSCSGGGFGPKGFLFATGHDAPELFVLSFPESGPTLKWVATIPVTVTGQAFGWDPRQPGVIYFVKRPGEIVIGRVTAP
jgi:hypothetical protein